ncbi:MAG: hypothetical protein KGM98_10585, partial [Bacteroidota bacterium]|nr:hypothetical protein [Bacteroidota bacterium]
MTNKEISGQFTLLSKLLDLHGENSFKVKSYSIAAYKIDQLTVGLQSLSKEKIFQLSGIGDAIGSKIQELLETGHMKILDETLVKTPEGILEMRSLSARNAVWLLPFLLTGCFHRHHTVQNQQLAPPLPQTQ